MQASASEGLSDFDLAEKGAEGLQPLHEIAHAIRELVDRLGQAQERGWSLFIEAIRPGSNGGFGDLKGSGGLRKDQPRAARSSRMASRWVG